MNIEKLLELTSPEVKAAIEQICDEAGTWDANWQVLKAAGELLAAAKAVNVCPVEVLDCYYNAMMDLGEVRLICKSGSDAQKVTGWLRGRMKDKTPPAA